jgi:mannose/cellobiose epimerase-like protein (N-acyl-D-glucosamine 2-epimerase family)
VYSHAAILGWHVDGKRRTIVDGTLHFLDEGLVSPSGGYRDADPGLDAIRRQNPHTHLLEVFLALYEATSRDDYRARAMQMFKLFATRFFRPSTGTLCEYLTESSRRSPAKRATSLSRNTTSGFGCCASCSVSPAWMSNASLRRSINMRTATAGTAND